MDPVTLPSAVLQAAPPSTKRSDDPVKIREAAQQFEALLLTQLLESAHPSGGWLGGGDDGAAGPANGLAEQQLAVMMARQGGIGLANLVAAGLERNRDR